MLSARPRLVTYSRTKRKLLKDDNISIKRRRVVDVEIYADDEEQASDHTVIPSSPPLEQISSEPPIFSDDNVRASTPPSSPPTLFFAEQLHDNSQEEGTKAVTPKPDAFSVLRRQPRSKLKEPRKKPLVQMQLNLGQSFQKKCRTCGMEFVPSSPEDLALHRKYHSQNVDGVSITKDFLKKAESWNGVEWHGRDGRDRIVSVSRHWRCRSGRQYVTPVLDVAQAELGAVDIPYNLLWSLCYTKLPMPGSTDARDSEVHAETANGPCYERYKVYLYISGMKCVGLCLAERIDKAYKVLASKCSTKEKKYSGNESNVEEREQGRADLEEDGLISIAETGDDAWMGISRIWVSPGFRQKGIASALLDCASKTFRNSRTTPKELIAFSQPTQSGARLARRWFGQDSGWHVYTDGRMIMEFDKGTWYSRKEGDALNS